MALSKDWTKKRLQGVIRLTFKAIDEDELLSNFIDDLIHLNVLEIANLLKKNNYPEYGEIVPVTVTNGLIDISSLRIDFIDKIIDTNYGRFIQVNQDEFENLTEIPQNQGNVYYYRYGDYILVYAGNSLSGNYGVTTLYYSRIPDRADEDGDYIDLSDRYMNLLIGKIKLNVYQSLKIPPPEEVVKGVENDIAKINEGNAS